MAGPKFRVGQTVELAPGPDGSVASCASFKVLSRHTDCTGITTYRVKTIRECHERLVLECEVVCAIARALAAGAVIVTDAERRSWPARTIGQLR